MLTTTTTFVATIAERIGPRSFALLGTGGPSRIDVTTRVTTSLERRLARGEAPKVLVDFVDDAVPPAERVAVFARELSVNQDDLERVEAVLERYRRAGVTDLVTAPRAYLEERFELLSSERFTRWDPRLDILMMFARKSTRFPERSWHDVSSGVEEMEGLLARLDVAPRWRKRAVVEHAQKDFDGCGFDTSAARDRLCEALVAVANEALERSGRTERFCGPFDYLDDPCWVHGPPSRYDALIESAALVRWGGRRPAAPARATTRPPDLGELNLDEFPTGDDPF